MRRPHSFARLAGIALILLGMVAGASAFAGPPTMKMTTDVPESITTPHKVETRIGTLEFFDGIPTKETAALAYDNLDFLRGVESFLVGIPATSLEAFRRGLAGGGAARYNQAMLWDKLMDSTSLFLTGNTDTVYCIAFFNVKEDGPMVVEIPAGTGPGMVNDAFFRSVIDMGPPGPDRGKGGNYLILPPGYEGDAPDGYFTATSPSYVNTVLVRGYLVDGKGDAAAKLFRDNFRIYPLSKAGNPPAMEFISGSGLAINTIHANNYEFFEELHTVIEREPVEMLHPELRGIFASIGIQKGKPFAPDARMKKILTDAAAVANATSRAIFWYERDESEFLYKDSYWKRGYVGGSWEYLRDEGLGGRHLDARTHFYYFATYNSPAMALKLIGKGSQYAWGYLDADGNYLDGSNTYKVNVPKDVPAEKFWSIVVYDPQTRSELQTDQPFPSRNNLKDKFIVNADGSVDVYFGPESPPGKESNWIQTVPGKGWFCLLRLYSPTEAYFDKTWRIGEIELVK